MAAEDSEKDPGQESGQDSSGESQEDQDFISLDGIDAVEEDQSEDQKEASETASSVQESSTETEDSAFEHYQASKDEMDQILAEQDGEFLKSLKDLKDLKKVSEEDAEGLGADTVELDPELLKDKETGRLSLFFQKFAILFKPLFFVLGLFQGLFRRIKGSGQAFKNFLGYLKGEGKTKLIAGGKKFWEAVKQPTTTTLHIIKKLSWKGRLLFVLAVSSFAFLFSFFDDLYRARFLPDPQRQDVTSFDDVAGDSFDAQLSLGLEPLDSPVRHPEHVVLLERVIVNLAKPPLSGGSPMGIFEFYVQTTNQEAAVEVKNRETEFIDRLQRAIEGMSYQQLNTVNGKKRLKAIIRRDFNQIMTKGSIKKVYLKSITLQR